MWYINLPVLSDPHFQASGLAGVCDYVGYEMDERKALTEFLSETGLSIKWFVYSSGQQCAGILIAD
jgi:hypothetical protein